MAKIRNRYNQFKKIIKRYIYVGYNSDVMQQSPCLVFNPITVYSYGFLFNSSLIARQWAGPQRAQHLTQDTNGKVTLSQLDFTNESQEVNPFPAGDHKAFLKINRCIQKHNKNKTEITQKVIAFLHKNVKLLSLSTQNCKGRPHKALLNL